MSLQGPLSASDADNRASADLSDAVVDQVANSDILKRPRTFLLEESRLDGADSLNGSLHLGQSVKSDATPVGSAQIVEAEIRQELIKPADIEAADTPAESSRGAVAPE